MGIASEIGQMLEQRIGDNLLRQCGAEVHKARQEWEREVNNVREQVNNVVGEVVSVGKQVDIVQGDVVDKG